MRSKIFLTVSLLILLCAQTNLYGIARPEYPRPQFVRSAWENLNGQWSYRFDFGKSGKERGFQESEGFSDEITVPFCPESKLSGVEHKDFINAMWYHREISIPKEWSGKRVVLHFGGVDFQSEVFIDGKSVGMHWGGTSCFSFDISKYVKPGESHNLVVYVIDETRKGTQPRGKQCPHYASFECLYTRTTGIWQTVWMEAVSKYGLRDCQIIPDLDGKRFIVNPNYYAVKRDYKLRAILKDGQEEVSSKTIQAVEGIPLILEVKDVKTWSPSSPFLYDLIFEVLNDKGKVLDEVQSYAGMRKIHIEGNRLYLNNKPIYLRFVLNQGFYPEGIWTAPSDEALKHDIELAMRAGFNGARLHQKIFKGRFHYWADKLGFLTWAESSNSGANANRIETARNFLSEWEELIVRRRNHPSIIAWTPFNETWERDESDGVQHNRFIRDVYDLTHNLDPPRPVNDTSGCYHVKTDLWTIHTYQQDIKKLDKLLTRGEDGKVYQHSIEKEVAYSGQPYFVDEYGGMKWAPGEMSDDLRDSWGWGDNPQTEEEFYERLEALTDVILSKDYISGYCYTQLTDVEQEKNGIYSFDRNEKFDMERISKIFSKTKD